LVVYKISLVLYFTSETDAIAVYNELKKWKAKIITINRGKPNEEKSILRREICYHDETPPRPCELIEEITSE